MLKAILKYNHQHGVKAINAPGNRYFFPNFMMSVWRKSKLRLADYIHVTFFLLMSLTSSAILTKLQFSINFET